MNERGLIRWLVASAIAVLVTLVVGGITRLTESGLSITEWNPVSGALPPMSASAWDAAFQSYLQIPEAQTVHKGITLAQFKALFWWEWIHRNLARFVGLVLALPYFWLSLRKQIPRGLRLRLLMLPILTAAQGALGWYMVSSGLAVRTDVSQYRLVAHLTLALIIYVIAIWTILDLRGAPKLAGNFGLRGTGAVAALCTIVSGGFVAGLDAGHIYNTFPLMGGKVIPLGYWQLTPGWRNLFENAATVQFNHRVLAISTLCLAVAIWIASQGGRDAVRRSGRWVLIAALVQVTLGISTLLLGVPIWLAALHQLGGVGVLTAMLWRWRSE